MLASAEKNIGHFSFSISTSVYLVHGNTVFQNIANFHNGKSCFFTSHQSVLQAFRAKQNIQPDIIDVHIGVRFGVVRVVLFSGVQLSSSYDRFFINPAVFRWNAIGQFYHCEIFLARQRLIGIRIRAFFATCGLFREHRRRYRRSHLLRRCRSWIDAKAVRELVDIRFAGAVEDGVPGLCRDLPRTVNDALRHLVRVCHNAVRRVYNRDASEGTALFQHLLNLLCKQLLRLGVGRVKQIHVDPL